MVNSDRTMTLLAARRPNPPGDAPPGLAARSPRRRRRMGFDEGFAFESSEEVFDEIRRFWNPQTGWDIRGVDYDRLRRGPVQWPAPPDDDADRHPIRYVNDGVSQSLHRRRRRHRAARWRSPTPSRSARSSSPARTWTRSELPDDDYPLDAQHRPAAAPVAHHDEDRQGRQARSSSTRSPFVEIHPRRRRAPGHRARATQVEISSRRGRAVLPAVVTDRVRPGMLLRAVPLERRARRVPHGQRRDERRRRRGVAAARVQVRARWRCGPGRGAGRDRAEPHRAARARSASPTASAPDRPPTPRRMYLAGPARAGGARPVAADRPRAPGGAPLRDLSRRGSTASSPGLYAAGGAAPVDDPADAADTGRGDGAVGVADRQRRGARRRIGQRPLADSAIPARTVSMVDMSSPICRRVRRLLVVTSTFGDGGPPDNAADLWSALNGDDVPRARRPRLRGASPSATRATTTSAATAAASTPGSARWAATALLAARRLRTRLRRARAAWLERWSGCSARCVAERAGVAAGRRWRRSRSPTRCSRGPTRCARRW